jgi:threonine synthase
MRYVSTRGGESGVPFERALLSAYACDGGLWVPETIPKIDSETLRSWGSLRMSQVTARVMEQYTDLSLAQLEKLTAAAFETFNGGAEPPLPCEKIFGDLHFLDTGLGPTLAFKDIGQQVVAQLLNVYLGQRGAHANVIVETSGDTGPAAIAGVAGCEHVDIFCLYPHGRVSDVQELQMVTWGDATNVHVFRTEGDTDEQAEALKLLFSDSAFMAKHNVVSINSINWARIMVQSSYYFWAYLQCAPKADRPVHFFVPTGAFGNAVGGLVAKLMGVPIGRIVCATNSNDVVHRTSTPALAFRNPAQPTAPERASRL